MKGYYISERLNLKQKKKTPYPTKRAKKPNVKNVTP